MNTTTTEQPRTITFAQLHDSVGGMMVTWEECILLIEKATTVLVNFDIERDGEVGGGAVRVDSQVMLERARHGLAWAAQTNTRQRVRVYGVRSGTLWIG